MEPIVDKIKEEIALGAQGYHVEDAGVPKKGEETESDEERRLQRLKWKPQWHSGTGSGQGEQKGVGADPQTAARENCSRRTAATKGDHGN
jgi:hypothetical protein